MPAPGTTEILKAPLAYQEHPGAHPLLKMVLTASFAASSPLLLRAGLQITSLHSRLICNADPRIVPPCSPAKDALPRRRTALCSVACSMRVTAKRVARRQQAGYCTDPTLPSDLRSMGATLAATPRAILPEAATMQTHPSSNETLLTRTAIATHATMNPSCK